MIANLIGISPYSLKACSFHSHSDWEVVLNLEGEGITFIGNTELKFYPGMIICYPPNVPHSKISKNKFKDIYIQVSGFKLPTNEAIPVFYDDEDKSFKALMFLALRIFHRKETNYISVVNSIYEAMHQLLLSWNEKKPKNDSVELFKKELIENFTDPEFKISDAAIKIPYCNDHFRRCFKKHTGTTPASYLMNLRIEYAKKLLKQMNDVQMKISQIALFSGFYDPHYFSRVFKSNTGMTPQDYAAKHKI